MTDGESIRIVDLTRDEAADLAAYLDEHLSTSGLRDEVQITVVTEKRSPRGLAFPIPPELMIFIKGVVGGFGSAAGKLLFEKLRDWASTKKNSGAKLMKNDEVTPLQDLPGQSSMDDLGA